MSERENDTVHGDEPLPSADALTLRRGFGGGAALADARLATSFERGALTGPELRRSVRAAFEHGALLEAVAHHPERCSLNERQEVGAVCIAATTALVSHGPGALSEIQREMLELVLSRLFVDRDPEVGARAAWAVGLMRCGGHGKALLRQLEAWQEPGSTGRHQRRLLAARAAAVLTGDLELADVLGTDATKDESSRAVLARALRWMVPLAPAVSAEIYGRLIEVSTDEALGVIAGTLLSFGSRDERFGLRDALQRRLSKSSVGGAPLATLVAWAPPGRANELYGQWSAVDDGLRRRDSVRGLLWPLLELLNDTAEVHDDELLEAARELILCETPILRSLVLSEGIDPGTLSHLYADVQAARLRALGDAKPLPEIGSRQLWLVARALDLAPRERVDHTDQPTASARLMGPLAVEAVRAVLALGRDPDYEPAWDRPAGIALAVGLEVAVQVGALAPSVARCALLHVPSRRLVRDVGAATRYAEVRALAMSLVEIRRMLEEALKKRSLPSQLSRALAELPDAWRLEGEHEGEDTFDYALGAAETLCIALEIEAHATLLAPYVDALYSGLSALRELAAVNLGCGYKRPPDGDRAAFESAIVAKLSGNVATIPERERSRLDRIAGAMTPEGLKDLWPVLLLPHPNRRPRAPALRRVLGDYAIVRRLGKGGMGECFLATRRGDTSDAPEQFVLKIPGANRTEASLSAFRMEAIALLELSTVPHRNIVGFRAFDAHLRPYLVMSYVPGPNLETVLRRGSLETTVAARATMHIAEALIHAQQLGRSHNDLKPSNVVCTPDPQEPKGFRPVLVDWGLSARAMVPSGGTLPYMAPERFAASPAMGGPADLFAVGCMLYEMLLGKMLHEPTLSADERALVGPTIGEEIAPWAAFQLLVAREALRLRRARSLPAPFGEIVCALVAQEPGRRPSASELSTWLASRFAG